jgi:hypothetical protein
MNFEHTAQLAVPDDLTIDEQLEMEDFDLEMMKMNRTRYEIKLDLYDDIDERDCHRIERRQVKEQKQVIEGKMLELRRRKRLLETKKDKAKKEEAGADAVDAEEVEADAAAELPE